MPTDRQPNANWTDLHFEWLWVYEGPVPFTEIWSKEIIVPASVFFVMEGHGEIVASGHKIEVPKGHAFLAAAGTRKQRFAKGTRLLSVAFRVNWPEGLPLGIPGLNRTLPPAQHRALFAASQKLFRSVHGRKRTVGFLDAAHTKHLDFASWCKREACFREWFALYAQTLTKLELNAKPRRLPRDLRLREIARRLDDWPLSQPLAWSQLASGMDVGSRRLEQLFITEYSLTPHAYLNQRRIETARHLLANSTLSLKQITHDLGLRHASHFTKWFRRHCQISPSSYRRDSSQAL